MRAFAEKTFELDAVNPEDGISYRVLLEGLLARETLPAKERAQHQAELACPPLPPALDYLWRIFHRLRRRKGGNGFGRDPIGWPDIDAFVRHSRFELAPFEIEILEDLDDLFLQDHTKPKAES